jgi:hypothetical protein
MLLKVPLAFDAASKKPSVTLLFAYISFFQTFTLITLLACYDELLYALIASFVLFLICIFFYRARKIDTLKVSRDGFEIGDDDDAPVAQPPPLVETAGEPKDFA